jgi:hypothetical protein
VRVSITASITRRAAKWPRQVISWICKVAVQNKLFAWGLGAGAALRLLAMLGYPGALWFSGDSYVYLGAALRPQPNLSKSTGYSFFLRLLLPFHSFTLVTGIQHLMGLLIAVAVYVLLRRHRVSRTWAAIATLPQLLDGYIIEDEHMIMAESLFTFLLVVGTLLLLWRPRPAWWTALVAGLLVGAAAVVRTEGEVMLAVLPLFLLLREWSWKTLRGWLVAAVFTVGAVVPVGAYMDWFYEHHGHYELTMSEGFYVWGRVSSFANCAVIKPVGREAVVCPTQPIVDRTPPGNYIWHAPYVQQDLNSTGGSVTYANDQLLTSFAIHAVEAQPLDYAKTVVKDVMLSFGFPRIAYPGAGTTYYYSFHLHYVTATYNVLPPATHAWIGPLVVPKDSAYDDWLNYGHQAPGVVHRIFAVPVLVYQRVVFTYGPLLAVIFLIGLGGVLSVTARRRGRGVKSLLSAGTLRTVRLHWRPRGTTMLPWTTAVALLVTPIAVADFDYRYLIPAIPFACLAAGLAFAPRSKTDVQGPQAADAQIETTVPSSIA